MLISGTVTKTVAVIGIVSVLAACKPTDAPLPPNVADPNNLHNPAGAQADYWGAVAQFGSTFAGDGTSFVPMTGLFTDELRSADIGLAGLVTPELLLDSRFLTEYSGSGNVDNTTNGDVVLTYSLLQRARNQQREARGALHAWAPATPHALFGQLFAFEGYTQLMLADFYCSGVPLSTITYGGDYTLAPSSTTAQVYEAALASFDSALALATDSADILNLARVGKGRALLALGQYADAAATVTAVPDGFQYAMQYAGDVIADPTNGFIDQNFASADFVPSSARGGRSLTMVDREGINGLAFLSSGDPRTPGVIYASNHGLDDYRPTMYDPSGAGPVVLASGVEARLIQAENQIQSGSASWLTTLNALRASAGLSPLTDPGTKAARIDLLFSERGFWLFLTGHRQGDLRRLVRQYGRAVTDVYPTGPYPGAYNTYSPTVTAPIPGTERISNPNFHGCLSRGA